MLVRLPGVLPAELLERCRSTLDAAAWDPGRRTALGPTADLKHNEQASKEQPEVAELAKAVLAALTRDVGFVSAVIPKRIIPPMFCRYRPSMSYGEHLDLPIMGQPPGQIRTDVAVTCGLSPAQDYDGGTLVIDTTGIEQRVRPEAGEVIVYPADTVHRVEEVTRGERRVAVAWVQSMVRDPGQRRILFDLSRAASTLEAADPEAVPAKLVRRSHYNLLRRWAES